jgi:FolB domain-containing protein
MPSAPSTLIVIQGIRARGRHGANPGERLEPQDFLVDLSVRVEATADSLERTLDYRTISEAARRTVETTSFELLESLAHALAAAVLGLEHAVRVTVVVHKPGAARRMEVADVSAEVTLDHNE